MRKTAGAAASLVLGLIALRVIGVSAEVPSAVTVEVDHLLDFVGHSGCAFFRNGEWYPATLASEHLRAKYEYLVTRGQIDRAEEFIEKVATKSSLTSRPYMVRCVGVPDSSSANWLRRELIRFRALPIQPGQ